MSRHEFTVRGWRFRTVAACGGFRLEQWTSLAVTGGRSWRRRCRRTQARRYARAVAS